MTKDLAALLQANEASLLMQETSHEELRDLDSDLPTDVHLVVYERQDGGDGDITLTCFDAVRAYKMVDIFDAYYDAGYVVREIRRGYGRIKPKLFVNAKQ